MCDLFGCCIVILFGAGCVFWMLLEVFSARWIIRLGKYLPNETPNAIELRYA